MATKFSGVDKVLIAAAGTGSPPTSFTDLGRCYPIQPEYEALSSPDGLGRPIYTGMRVSFDVDLVDVSKKQTTDTYDDSTADVAWLLPDGNYRLFSSVQTNSSHTARDGRQVARLRVTEADNDITNVTDLAGSADTPSEPTPPVSLAGARSGYIKHVSITTSTGTIDCQRIGEGARVEDASIYENLSNLNVKRVGVLYECEFLLKDPGVFATLNTSQIALQSATVEVYFLDDSKMQLSSVYFTATPYENGELGELTGVRFFGRAYGATAGDVLTIDPALS